MLKRALTDGTVADRLASFTPKPGDGVFIPAGTVHSLGGGVVVFEVQQNSDVTFRLHDWNRVDTKTGKPRPLQVEQAIACIDFEQACGGPVVPVMEGETPVLREQLFFVSIFDCGDTVGNCRLWSERRERRVCWCALLERLGWNIIA